jgi:HAMP domain-containing protein
VPTVNESFKPPVTPDRPGTLTLFGPRPLCAAVKLQRGVSMFLLKLLGVLAGLAVLAILAFGIWFVIQIRPRRRRESGFRYVYVENDGAARELDADEQEYLNTSFHPADGARPYIKISYESLTPDGRLSGYLRRRQLPKGILVRPAPSNRKVHLKRQ